MGAAKGLVDCELHDDRVTPGLVVLTAALMIVGPPLSLALMGLTLRLLGVSKSEVQKRALKFTDRWIEEHGKRGASAFAKTLITRGRGDQVPP